MEDLEGLGNAGTQDQVDTQNNCNDKACVRSHSLQQQHERRRTEVVDRHDIESWLHIL